MREFKIERDGRVVVEVQVREDRAYIELEDAHGDCVLVQLDNEELECLRMFLNGRDV